ncbi:MAG: MBL fold metallo-hydrolase [Bryobacterales bacterium]|nr:MBL fold metallo-hydrolase [Bryobacterales bacterium]
MKRNTNYVTAYVVLLGAAAGIAQAPARPVENFATGRGALRIVPVRHASLMIEAGGQAVHVDPWGQGDYEGLPRADIIIITHAHGDHLDPSALARLRKAATLVIAPEGTGVPGAFALAPGESRTAGNWTFEAVAMYNRGPDGGRVFHEKGKGAGYVVSYGGMRIYIAGDTSATPEMASLQRVDVAFLPMNLPYTMTPEEAAAAAKSFRPKIVYPYHYRGSDLAAFEKALAGSGIEVRIRDWYY